VSAATETASSATWRSTFVGGWWLWLSVLARLVVGVVWIVAGALKLENTDDSVRAVRAYQILPEAVVPAVGRGLPALEVIVGALLVVGLGLRIVGALSALMQVAFIIGLSAAWARSIPLECGCFGGGGLNAHASTAHPWDITRDVGLFLLSLGLACWPRSHLSLDGVLLPPIEDED
jgi:uncharacterized membrane protein YphA (DoxX/SURF4 family)